MIRFFLDNYYILETWAIGSSVAFFKLHISYRDETRTDEERRRDARAVTWSSGVEIRY